MKYLFIVLLVALYSCNGNKRDFFQNLKTENHFLDTFSLSNLKGFGISNKLMTTHGKGYYEFNNSSNAIYIGGSFRKDASKLFFLPKDSETEILFLDPTWNTSTRANSKQITTKNKDFYDVTYLGLSYNSVLRDSTFSIKINGDGIFTPPESLVFEVRKNLEILKIEHVDCKGDTLLMGFYPKQVVYYTHFNSSAVCL